MTEKKYIKYKKKYLELKNNNNLFQYGGKLTLLTIKNINIFTNPDMEKFLNPIYGLIMSKTDYIDNILKLDTIRHFNPKNSIIDEYNAIKCIINPTNREYKPNNAIINRLTPFMIGQYLALLYYCKDKNKETITTLKIKFNKIIYQMKITYSYIIADNGEVKNYTSVSNIKKNIVLGTQKKKYVSFIIILFMVDF